jgi:hypothetical protein
MAFEAQRSAGKTLLLELTSNVQSFNLDSRSIIMAATYASDSEVQSPFNENKYNRHGAVQAFINGCAVVGIFVNRNGDVFSSRSGEMRKLKQYKTGNRKYLGVSVNRRILTVHRIVCSTFNGNCPVGKNLALHRDGNSLNNNADNLYWGNSKDNSADALSHGTTYFLKHRFTGDEHWMRRFPSRVGRGEESKTPKLKNGDVIEIRKLRESGEKLSNIAAIYGITHQNASLIVHRKTWTHI